MWKIKDIFNGLRNFWKFRREVYNFKSYEYEGSLKLFKKGLLLLADDIQKNDASYSKESKLEDIVKCTYCINILTDESWVEDFRKSKDCEGSIDEIRKAALERLCYHLKGGDTEQDITYWWV